MQTIKQKWVDPVIDEVRALRHRILARLEIDVANCELDRAGFVTGNLLILILLVILIPPPVRANSPGLAMKDSKTIKWPILIPEMFDEEPFGFSLSPLAAAQAALEAKGQSRPESS